MKINFTRMRQNENNFVAAKKPSVTVGIPAYNEEANIKCLLNALNNQKEIDFTVDEIVIISDGSQDCTESIVREFCEQHSRFHLVADGKRRGKYFRMNELMQDATSDILVLLDADIFIENQYVLQELVHPLIQSSDLMHVSGYALPVPPKTFVEKIAKAGVMVWECARRNPRASKLYCSEGRIRAFRRNMYQNMRFPNASADEAFSFFFGELKGFAMHVVEKALVRYRLPSNFSDYMKQMQRFLKSEGVQEKEFDPHFVKRYYNIGFFQKFSALVKSFANNPFFVSLYCITVAVGRVVMIVNGLKKDSGIWEAIQSTKLFNDALRVVISNFDDKKNPHYGGGGSVAVHEVAKRLVSEYGFDVTVITGKYSKCKNEIIDGVRYDRIGISFLGPKFGQFLYHFFLLKHVIFRSFDVWVESFTPPFSTSFTPLCTRKPVIGLVHMLSGEDMRRKYGIPFQIIERFGLRFYKRCIVLSEHFKNTIARMYPDMKVYVIPNGVEQKKLFSDSKQEKHILFFGRIEVDQKGLDILVRAFSEVRDVISLPLVIAGSGSDAEIKKLRSLVESSGLREKVKLLGRVSGTKKKRQLFRDAEMMILPSRFETFSLVALESMASGTPLVVFDTEEMQWIPSRVCVKVKPFEIKKLADAMMNVHSDAKKRKKLSSDGVNFALHYDWDVLAKRYKDVIFSAYKHKRV